MDVRIGADRIAAEPGFAYLKMRNNADDVALVRHVLGAVGATYAFSGEFIADVKIAAGEACANVVQHAYDADGGCMVVGISASSTGLEVLVRDRGHGMQAHSPRRTRRSLGAGLALIQALTESVELRGSPEVGTDVLMRFSPVDGRDSDMGAPAAGIDTDALAAMDDCSMADSQVLVRASGRVLNRPVYAAAAAAMAARASLSLEKLADVQLISDMLAGYKSPNGMPRQQTLEMVAKPEELMMQLGPFQAGTAAQILRSGQLDGLKPLEALAQGHGIESKDQGQECLWVRVIP